jgi:hypothetical protein
MFLACCSGSSGSGEFRFDPVRIMLWLASLAQCRKKNKHRTYGVVKVWHNPLPLASNFLISGHEAGAGSFGRYAGEPRRLASSAMPLNGKVEEAGNPPGRQHEPDVPTRTG